ncbi:alpha/beta hydrolase-fold protein [Streptomyces lavendulae]|uniref:alpha/beta hydrolase-fold protein n=1 Tax=Streptomyces lavendulae TaxID=1914 RepID=UPI0036CF483F
MPPAPTWPGRTSATRRRPPSRRPSQSPPEPDRDGLLQARPGRTAIADISMGGFGAFRYAQRHPDLFSQVGSLSGSPYPVFNADWRWSQADPVANADELRGMGIHICIGNGDGGNHDVREWWLESASAQMAATLDSLGIPVHYENYGNGATWGEYCKGCGHEAGCRYQDLLDLIPRLQSSLTPAA